MTAIDTEARIRDRAYALWENAGRPDGQDKDFWRAAERELAEESGLDLSSEDPKRDELPPTPRASPHTDMSQLPRPGSPKVQLGDSGYTTWTFWTDNRATQEREFDYRKGWFG